MEINMKHDVVADIEQRMNNSIESLKISLSKIRTGRAHVSILDQVKVDYYGNLSPLNQVANVIVEDARTLAINPWDKSTIPLIEKAIYNADLGLNPVTDKDFIRIPIPALTEERRRDIIKLAKEAAEQAKIAIRNLRRDANQRLKEVAKTDKLGEDEVKGIEHDIQIATDKAISETGQILDKKETDIMQI